MFRVLAVCGIKQHKKARDLHITDEIVNREIVSNYQYVLDLEADKLRNMDKQAIQMHNGNNVLETKTFYFTNVKVNVTGDSVEVEFQDGHRELFDKSEVVKSYKTLRLSDHGAPAVGVTKNKSSDTVHLVNSNGLPVCGDSNLPRDDDPMDLDIDADSLSLYRPFCGRCKNMYTDGFIQTLIDLRLKPLY